MVTELLVPTTRTESVLKATDMGERKMTLRAFLFLAFGHLELYVVRTVVLIIKRSRTGDNLSLIHI